MESVQALRRFNRSFTARIGVLDDRFLGLDRPLGHARVLFELGLAGGDVAVGDLRSGLALDSGYLSRILRALEADGLVEVIVGQHDARKRVAHLTAAGRAEWRRLDERSDQLAAQLIERLGVAQRDRLTAALGEADRLLAAAQTRIEVVDPHDAEARAAVGRYAAELERIFPDGFDAHVAAAADVDALAPPGGRFVVARADRAVVGCGGVQVIEPGIAELKRMWVDEGMRGTGLGGRLLRALEAHARDLGCTVVRLDTNSALSTAVAMYRRAGYRPIPRYNTNPYPDLFFEKDLAAQAG